MKQSDDKPELKLADTLDASANEAEKRETVEQVLAEDPETAQDIIDWQQATYLLIGTLLMQQGKLAARISVVELEKFRSKYTLDFKQLSDGSLHYSLRPIPKKQ